MVLKLAVIITFCLQLQRADQGSDKQHRMNRSLDSAQEEKTAIEMFISQIELNWYLGVSCDEGEAATYCVVD